MDRGFVVRVARLDDVPQMARVVVTSWRETYRGLMPDSVLDDPDLVARREHFWTAALTDPRYAQNHTVINLNDETRRVVRRDLRIPDDLWARGRGWPLWTALNTRDEPGRSDTAARALQAFGVTR